MISPAIIVIAIVACSVIAAVIETIVQSRRNKFAQHMSEVSNDLADAFCKANKSVGVSCEDAIKNLEKSLTIIAETTSTNSNIWIASDYMSENRTNMITLRKPDTIVHDAASFTPRNCPNCGAPVRSGECEYCGTVFTSNSIAKWHPALPDNMDTFGFAYSDNPLGSISTKSLPTKIQRG